MLLGDFEAFRPTDEIYHSANAEYHAPQAYITFPHQRKYSTHQKPDGMSGF